MICIDDILHIDCRPAPYEPGAELWNDTHISTQMLAAHLAPDTDAASYRPQKIRAICDYLPGRMFLPRGSAIADLGCRPGLYASALAERGYRVTGIDRSENSIRYGREQDQNHRVDYRQASYLDPFGEEAFDAVLLISEDYGVLRPEERQRLLSLIFKSLRPGGWFARPVPCTSAASVRTLRLEKHRPQE
jgi:SAM-dependent methyltransferase